MEISIKWNVCRVCLLEENRSGLKQSGSCGIKVGRSRKNSSGCGVGSVASGNVSEMKNIFSDSKLPKQIFECSGVIVKPNDSMPDKICRDCLTMLKYAVHFGTTCRNSDEYLQSVIQKTRSATSLIKLDRRREQTMELVDSIFNEEDEDADCGSDEADGDGDKIESLSPKNHTEQMENAADPIPPEVIGDSVNDTCKPIEKYNQQFEKELKGEQSNQTLLMASSEGIMDIKGKSSTTDLRQRHEREAKDRDSRLNLKAVNESDSYVVLMDEDDQDEMDERDLEELEEQEGKKDRLPKITSVCSIEDDGYLDDGEEENFTTLEVTHEGGTTKTIVIEEEGEEDGVEVEAEGEGENVDNTHLPVGTETVDIAVADSMGEHDLFYVLDVNNIKQEYEPAAVEVNVATVELVHSEDETEVAADGHVVSDETVNAADVGVGENAVEYLIDESTEDCEVEFRTARDTSRNSVTIKGSGSRRWSPHSRKKVGNTYVYVCDVCGNKFTNRNLMNYHMRTHRNEKNYECELCFKRFNAACNLTAHMRIHTGEKPYECQYCHRRFTDRSTHIKHERIHTNEKPFQCNVCGKSFSLSTSLRAHEKLHTGEKPYKCEPCSKSFKLPHQLKAHLNTQLHKLLTVEQDVNA